MIEGKKFQRRKEDFTCEHCGFFVEGNGYTNHCPKCLWCKHVDVNPGDRAAACRGMMEPVGLERKRDDYIITHACVACGFQRKNRSAEEDSVEMLAELARRQADALAKKGG
jgi:Zn ribbon nucleic-acid-binding protein